MNVDQWLTQATARLNEAGIGTARLDSLILLEDIACQDRAWLLAHPEFVLAGAQLKKLENVLSRRAGHEPLAYIRGRTEFYGREFLLTKDVLEPRPESETMIDLLKALPVLASGGSAVPSSPAKNSQSALIADIGTGSGALGITAQLELPNTHVALLEVDPKAAKIAQINVDKFTLSISITVGDLLAKTDAPYDVLLCNLPYVPDSFHINQAAMREPKLAIFGGADGLDVYRKLFKQLKKRPQRPLYILCESLPPQHTKLTSIAEEAGYNQTQEEDFIQVFKKQVA